MNGLFKQTNLTGIRKGSLIKFKYLYSQAKKPNVIHDTRPVVVVTDFMPNYIRGVNIHYLTFPIVKNLLNTHAKSGGFSYASIKGNGYIAEAFRMYKRNIEVDATIEEIDYEVLLNLLGSVRSYTDNELQQVYNKIEAQIQSRLQIKADELESYNQWRNQQFTAGTEGGGMETGPAV